MYGADNIKTMEYTDLLSRHTLNNNVYEIMQNEKLSSKMLDAQCENRSGI